MPIQVMTPYKLVDMCHDCARNIYSKKPPTLDYALRVTRLLAGTAATETHLTAQRQGGFSLANPRGAWGLFQTEEGSALRNISRLQNDEALRYRAGAWLFQDQGSFKAIFELPPLSLLKLIHDWHRLACLFARMHYFYVPEPVPATDVEMAAYYKKHYNTDAGSGSVEKYMRDFALVKPELDTREMVWRAAHR